MNLTWHIVKKDLRALKWPFALWALLIVAKLGVGVLLLNADGTEEPEWFIRMDGLSKILAAFEGVSFVLAAAVIQQDLMVGTKAFWMTRPISGGRLLRAKLLILLLVFGLLPLLITLPWWLGCGYGLREIGWAALETTAIHAACVLLGILWAVVTDGFGRFLMWTLVTLFAIPTLSGTLAYYLTRGKPGPSGELVTTRFALGIAIAVVGILIVVAHQYLARRTGRSIALIATTASLIIVVAVLWPWNLDLKSKWYSFLDQRVERDWPLSAEPAGLTFTVERAQLLRRPNARPDWSVQLRLDYRVQGLPETQMLMPYVGDYSLHWPDGFTEKGWAASRMGKGWYDRAVLKVTGVPMTPVDGPDLSQISQMIRPAVVPRLEASPAAYALRSRFGLLEIESTTRVQAGARTSDR
ncbi:MAG: hypothetical protein ABUL68_05085, partial [Pseudomonadota bacterium]